MPWVESDTEHFHCRHNSQYDADAARVLALLERLRERLHQQLPKTVEHLTVVLHDTPASLALSHPMMSLSWRAVSPTVRPYVTGWFNKREMHVLSPQALRTRATGITGSYEMLRLAPASLYTKRVVYESNVDLATARAPARRALETRWAWLLEGTARWLSGESEYARSVVAAHVRGGNKLSFPPSARDAPLLAPTVMEVLAQQQGDDAVAAAATRLPAQGPRAALSRAFGGKALMNIESDWRRHLQELAYARP
jgi:hypothetical protein